MPGIWRLSAGCSPEIATSIGLLPRLRAEWQVHYGARTAAEHAYMCCRDYISGYIIQTTRRYVPKR